MADRSAASGNFGMDFQTNAGIVIMLDYIKDMKSIKLEGNYEDIDIELSDGNHILAQAKSVVDATNDFRSVRGNLKKALLTLSEGEAKVKNKTTRLIYITNSPNPFKDNESKPIFAYLSAIRHYNSIPESSRKLIDEYLTDISVPLNTDKLYIQSLPFETDENNERYKYIYQKIRDFLEPLNHTSKIPGLWKNTFTIWNENIFKNGSRRNKDLTLKKILFGH